MGTRGRGEEAGLPITEPAQQHIFYASAAGHMLRPGAHCSEHGQLLWTCWAMGAALPRRAVSAPAPCRSLLLTCVPARGCTSCASSSHSSTVLCMKATSCDATTQRSGVGCLAATGQLAAHAVVLFCRPRLLLHTNGCISAPSHSAICNMHHLASHQN